MLINMLMKFSLWLYTKKKLKMETNKRIVGYKIVPKYKTQNDLII